MRKWYNLHLYILCICTQIIISVIRTVITHRWYFNHYQLVKRAILRGDASEYRDLIAEYVFKRSYNKIVSIKEREGLIISPGFREFEKTHYPTHPDTNVVFVGSQIQEWMELIEITKEMALRIPRQHLVGWDMAYGIHGWVMVEGNSNPGIQIQGRCRSTWYI